MKTYIRPELSIDTLVQNTAVSIDDPIGNEVTNGEVEMSTNDWWDILG